MTQRDRDRLVVLKKAQKKLIKQTQAARELDLTTRQVRRLLVRLNQEGDRAVIHKLRGRTSHRKIDGETREEAYGFGPRRSIAAALAQRWQASTQRKSTMFISGEALRQIMIAAGLWRAKEQKIEAVHRWRERRNSRGELVQWDTGDHDWLEGRGESLYLIHMIDDATQLTARFVRSDSTEENMRLLWEYLERQGRPVAFYTDKASLFHTAPKTLEQRARFCGGAQCSGNQARHQRLHDPVRAKNLSDCTRADRSWPQACQRACGEPPGWNPGGEIERAVSGSNGMRSGRQNKLPMQRRRPLWATNNGQRADPLPRREQR